MTTNSLTLLATTALTTVGVTTATALDWAQWRGPDRNGHSKETGLLKEWPAEGPKLLWQASSVGSGYSTPSVVGERIYLLSNEGLDNEFAVALSAKDGSKIWSTRLGKVGNPDQQPSYPAARSTPTVDGELLYALGSDGDLVCLEARDGKERWRKQLRSDFGGKPGQWAYSESPLVDGEKLICTPGGKGATLVALNKKTGETIWKCATPEGDDATYASAVIVEAGGVRQYVQFLAKGLVGLDADSGKLLWRYEASAKGSPAVVITPVAEGDYVYSGAYQAGGGLVKLSSQDGKINAEQVYFDRKMPFGIGGAIKVGNHLYGASGPSLLCVDFMTGNPKWEERGVGPSSFLLADGRLYLHAENGDMALLDPAADTYVEKGRFSPSNPPERGQSKAWTFPVIADGRLYIRELNSLWCYDIKSAN